MCLKCKIEGKKMFLRFGVVFLSRKSGNEMMGSKSGVWDQVENILTRSKFLRDLSFVLHVIRTFFTGDVWYFKYFVECGIEKVELDLFS